MGSDTNNMIKGQTNAIGIDVKKKIIIQSETFTEVYIYINIQGIYIYIYYIMFKDLDSLTWFKEIKKA